MQQLNAFPNLQFSLIYLKPEKMRSTSSEVRSAYQSLEKTVVRKFEMFISVPKLLAEVSRTFLQVGN